MAPKGNGSDQLHMEPSTFRTFSLNLFGAPNAAIPIVGPAPYYQRVLLQQSAGTAGALISSDASELNLAAGGALPGGAFQMAVGGNPVIVVLAPYQSLAAAGATVLGGDRLAVHVSQAIPKTKRSLVVRGLNPTEFRTRTLPLAGTAPAVQIAPSGRTPRRVVVRGNAGVVFLSPSSSDLDLPGQAVPGNSFELLSAGGAVSQAVFILAPGQHLAAARGVVGVNLSVSISEIPTDVFRGMTGQPGVDTE